MFNPCRCGSPLLHRSETSYLCAASVPHGLELIDAVSSTNCPLQYAVPLATSQVKPSSESPIGKYTNGKHGMGSDMATSTRTNYKSSRTLSLLTESGWAIQPPRCLEGKKSQVWWQEPTTAHVRSSRRLLESLLNSTNIRRALSQNWFILIVEEANYSSGFFSLSNAFNLLLLLLLLPIGWSGHYEPRGKRGRESSLLLPGVCQNKTSCQPKRTSHNKVLNEIVPGKIR